MAVPENGQAPFAGLFPALIQWESAPPTLQDTGVRLEVLRLFSPVAETLRATLGPMVGDAPVEIAQADVARIEAVLTTPGGPVTL
jgi:hypothetical protein